jgi:ribosomal 30S subunit maturation factor RimM
MGTQGAMTAPLYAVGRIVKAFGIKGEVVVQSMTSSPSRFKKLGHVFVGSTEAEAEASEVEYVSVEHRGVRVKLGSVHNRTEAERLGRMLCFCEQEGQGPADEGNLLRR